MLPEDTVEGETAPQVPVIESTEPEVVLEAPTLPEPAPEAV